MLKYKVGDLIEAAKSGEVNVIAHQCNCFCTMKSGIAPQIAKNFPDAYEVDQATEAGDKRKLGKFSLALHDDGPFNIWIYNLYGQYNYGKGKHTDYEALRSSLNRMSTCCNTRDRVGLPKLGAGFGGGDWGIIEAIIKDELVTKGINVTIYTLD